MTHTMKAKWTATEDALLRASVTAMQSEDGAPWSRIARLLPGRTAQACRCRHQHLAHHQTRSGPRHIDLGLAVLATVTTPPGYTWSLKDLGEICNCSWQAIYHIEQKALSKLRRRAQRLIA